MNLQALIIALGAFIFFHTPTRTYINERPSLTASLGRIVGTSLANHASMKTRPKNQNQPEVIYLGNVNGDDEKLRTTQEALGEVTRSLHSIAQRESELSEKVDVMLQIVARLRKDEAGGRRTLA
ncbi:hypothetical protein LTR70_001585 [Exophiala xenobiotica]|uniref:Uncharacterized protein n=1 Tax=Lithohypha guttulata TaxID=1690604 RepID=A0ABR0KDI5_9EURO|nr:hypothetical protein LTR24_003968 [Lithohypha guttulata]KAK5327962.1 hypothetical protein LTR70_001585 [Exophiala xenobiotica]